MQTEWGRGYPVGETYPVGWHSELSPQRIRLACTMQGVHWDPPADLSICDLGCASGFTLNVLAAANPDWRVTGIDYNPAHIAQAQALAKQAGLSNARFLEADLAEIADAALDALPDFDVVTMYGFWTWVSDPVRQGALRLIRRKLKPGGVVMLGYNVMPPNATALGLQRFARDAFARHATSARAKEDILAFVHGLREAEAANLLPSPWLARLLEQPDAVMSDYLLHEWATEHWRPAFFADVAADMASAQLDYAGSATLDENRPELTLKPAQQRLRAQTTDPVQQETITDFCVHRPLRRDIFVRGLRRVPVEPLLGQIPLARCAVSPVLSPMRTQLGAGRLPEAPLRAIVGALDRGPRTLGELSALPGAAGLQPASILLQLVLTDMAAPLWNPGATSEAARRLNRVIAEQVAPDGPILNPALAAPALGNGLPASPDEMRFFRVLAARPEGPWNDLEALAQGVLPAGAPDGSLEEARKVVRAVLARRVPVFRELGIL